jgi:hypothetical protein
MFPKSRKEEEDPNAATQAQHIQGIQHPFLAFPSGNLAGERVRSQMARLDIRTASDGVF